MQNSLERLLRGVASSLLETVLPTTDDAFARSQIAAAAELLENLATRVEWRGIQLWGRCARARPLLEAAVKLAGEHELEHARAVLETGLPLAPAPASELAELHERYMRAAGEVQEWAVARCEAEPIRAPLIAQLLDELDDTGRLMRHGMYRHS
jgi:hypothetical protein